METIAKWAIVALMTWGALSTIANVGKPRKVTTPGVAAAATLINAAIITAIVVWW